MVGTIAALAWPPGLRLRRVGAFATTHGCSTTREQEAELVLKKNISVEPAKCCIHSHSLCTTF